MSLHDKEKEGSQGEASVVGAADVDFTAAEERRVRWQIDRTVLVVFFFVYMWQYLDKIALSCTCYALSPQRNRLVQRSSQRHRLRSPNYKS